MSFVVSRTLPLLLGALTLLAQARPSLGDPMVSPEDSALVGQLKHGQTVQLHMSARLRRRARPDSPGNTLLAPFECVRVRGSSQNDNWLLIETGDHEIGWVLRDALQPQRAGPGSATRIGAGCEVSPARKTELRAKPTRRSERRGLLNMGELLWVEATNEPGDWLLVESSSQTRGWLRRRDVSLLAPEEEPFQQKSRKFPHGARVEAKSADTPHYGSPNLAARRGTVGSRRTLSVIDSQDDWLLVESANGTWAWIRSEDVQEESAVALSPPPAEPNAERDAPPPEPSAPSRLRFKGEIRTSVSIPATTPTTPLTRSQTVNAHLRGYVLRKVGDWTLGGWARLTVSADPENQGQAFDMRALAGVPVTSWWKLRANVGYTISQKAILMTDKTLAVAASNGPAIVFGTDFALGSKISLEFTLVNAFNMSINDGQRVWKHVLVEANELWFNFVDKFGFFAAFNVARDSQTGKLGYGYESGVEVRF